METKYCPRCEKTLPLAEFNKNKAKKDGLQTRCKRCDSESGKKYYKRDPARYKARASTQRRAYRDWFRQYKQSLACVRCGDSRWYVLEFHHKDDDKENEVSTMIANQRPKEVVLEEIAKCEPVCANCHREIHHLEREARVAQLDRASG